MTVAPSTSAATTATAAVPIFLNKLLLLMCAPSRGRFVVVRFGSSLPSDLDDRRAQYERGDHGNGRSSNLLEQVTPPDVRALPRALRSGSCRFFRSVAFQRTLPGASRRPRPRYGEGPCLSG